MNKRTTMRWYGVLLASIFALDRITKMIALRTLSTNAYELNRFARFDLAFNRGISWGMFHADGNSMFVWISIMVGLITFGLAWYAFFRWLRGYRIIGETLVIAGSLSNLFDRIVYRGVVDFIELSAGSYSWPLFNVADMAIVAGVVLMFTAEFREP